MEIQLTNKQYIPPRYIHLARQVAQTRKEGNISKTLRLWNETISLRDAGHLTYTQALVIAGQTGKR